MNVLHILSWPDSDEADVGNAKEINEKVGVNKVLSFLIRGK